MPRNAIIQKLGEIRKVPQILYNQGIEPDGMIKLREVIDKYIEEGYNNSEVDFIIQSGGGSPDDAYRIIRALRTNFKTVNIVVPFWAKSAATLLSLGASKIVMDEYGEFGPLDVQLGKIKDDGTGMQTESALNDEHSVARIEARFKEMYESMYIRLYEHKKVNISKNEMSKQLLENLTKFYSPLLSQINPYQLGDKKRKLEIGAQYAKRILLQFNQNKISVQNVRMLVEYLVNGCPDHSYIVDLDLIKPLLGDIVITANEFAGIEYSRELGKLSMYFMTSLEENEFVGLIYNPYAAIETKEKQEVKIPEELTNFAPRKSSKNGRNNSKKTTANPKLN